MSIRREVKQTPQFEAIIVNFDSVSIKILPAHQVSSCTGLIFYEWLTLLSIETGIPLSVTNMFQLSRTLTLNNECEHAHHTYTARYGMTIVQMSLVQIT